NGVYRHDRSLRQRYECGKRLSPDRIVGGKDAELGSWPWIAILGGNYNYGWSNVP
ncbi:hypothetical protein SK128_020916, partial [Halocaridina rubra]